MILHAIPFRLSTLMIQNLRTTQHIHIYLLGNVVSIPNLPSAVLISYINLYYFSIFLLFFFLFVFIRSLFYYSNVTTISNNTQKQTIYNIILPKKGVQAPGKVDLKTKQKNYFANNPAQAAMVSMANVFIAQQTKATLQKQQVSGVGIQKAMQKRQSKLKNEDSDLDNIIGRISRNVRQNPYKDEEEVEKQKKVRELYLVARVQACFRRHRVRKAYLVQRKNHRYRRSVIYELIQTEENYNADLDIIITKIMEQSKKLLTSKQNDTLFSNIKQLKLINGDFLKEVKVKFSPYPPYGKLGALLLEFAPFFKIYFQYYNDFNSSAAVLEQLRKENQPFNKFVNDMSKSKDYKFLDIESYLVKPVQRLPKYVLLLKDLFKHTDKEHPDYDNLQKALDMYSKVTEENNSKLDKVMNNRKIFELQRLFGRPNGLELVDAKREYVGEEMLTLFWRNGEKSVTVYFLSDMLLVTERTMTKFDQELISAMQLNEDSLCRDMPDTQFFKNLFTVHGEKDTLTFIEQTPETKQKKMLIIDNIITDLKGKSVLKQEAFSKNMLKLGIKKSYPITIQMVGTEERKSMFKSHTVYLLNIQIANIGQNVFVRFKDLLELQEEIQKLHPKLSLQYMTKKTGGVAKNSAKLIETRSFQIVNFLTSLLQSDPIKQKPDIILSKLGLPENFYQLPELLDQTRVSNLTSSPKDEEEDDGLKRRNVRKFSVMDYESQRGPNTQSVSNLNSSEFFSCRRESDHKMFGKKFSASKLIRQSGNSVDAQTRQRSGQKNTITEKPKAQASLLSIQINHFHPKCKPIELQIQSDARVLDLYELVSQFLGLLDTFDYKFLLMDSKKQFRPLEEDEIVANLFGGPSIFDKLMKDKKELYFRKLIFLDFDYEESQLQEDNVKLQMVYNQFVCDIQSNQFPLQFQDYCLISAWIGFQFINFFLAIPVHQNFPFDQLTNIIPSSILKATKKEIWQQYVPEKHAKISQQIGEVSEKSAEQRARIAMLVFIHTLYSFPLCGQQLYQVQAGKDTQKSLKSSDQIMFIGVGYKGVTIFDQRKKNSILTLEWFKFGGFKIFPGTVVLSDVLDKSYKFETSQGLQIQLLMDQYLNIREQFNNDNIDLEQ